MIEIGWSPTYAAWALGFVSLVAIPGQIALGYLSDRIGREWVWTVGSAGFVACYVSLLILREAPTPAVLYLMVLAQGMLGYGLTSVVGAIPAEIFQGRHYGAVFGTLSIPFFKQFGVGLAAAILIDATIVRGVLLPATMKLLGTWNWYLPSWLEWLPRIEVEAAR